MARITTQGLLRAHLDEILAQHKFPLYQIKTLRKLSVCRTEQLGAHSQYCEAGHLNGVWYNSCKNRSCPQCQGIAREEWLQNTQQCLLDCPHHHIVFTLPESLNELLRYNRELMADLLFGAVNTTLKKFSQSPQYFGGTAGLLMVLHTWGRNLSLHPHIHCIMSHGGLDAKSLWVSPQKKILFPQKPVMMVFRGRFLAGVRKALDQGKLTLPPKFDDCAIRALANKLGCRDWVVHFCERYEHSRGVAKYLSRYVRGGPFKNQQLSQLKDGKVAFRYQSHQTKRQESLVLTVEGLVQRMAQHIALPRKPNVRYGGLYSASLRPRLNLARECLGQAAASERVLLNWQVFLEQYGLVPTCKECGLPLLPMITVSKRKH